MFLCSNIKTKNMAIAIKSIPVLHGKEAEAFVKKADAAFQNKQESNQTQKRFESLNRILKKANMK
ncbi:hypothetical protein DWX23_21250 [Parabacteroides sp. AF18-52]|nr:hypothetical protein DWX23_21250 [Parabacteroides sp. AF18-52]